MEGVSQDEEDDERNLISEPEVKHRRSSFRIDDAESLSTRHRFNGLGLNNWNNRYYYVLAISLPLIIAVIYFSPSFRRTFFSGSVANSDRVASQMRANELQAVYLLKQQQSSLLLLLLNYSFSNSSNNGGNKNNLSLFDNLDDLKSALVKQISLSKQIEDVLMARRELENETGSLMVHDSGDSVLEQVRCPKVNQRSRDRKTIEWNPRGDKFLFVICLSGQMSNHLICLEKHMLFAALLNRVLVIPSPKFDFEYSRVLDVEHVNDCLGRKVVVSFQEFLLMEKNKLRIDRFVCYFSLPTHCYLDDEHLKRLKGLGISVGKFESPWKEDVAKPSKRTIQNVLDKFVFDDDVIAIGDVFYAAIDEKWVTQAGGPIAHKCKTLVEPSKLIMLTAQRFIQTFLGRNFIALHFRRHGFLKFCNAKSPSCFYPIPQAADCVKRLVGRVDAPVIYLSTDAAASETNLLQSLVASDGRTVPFVQRPTHNSAEKWDALLYRHGLRDDPQVEAMLDKTICALSNVFVGAMGSTFTEDIFRLRKDWGASSLCDEYLCQGELPNFIAHDE